MVHDTYLEADIYHIVSIFIPFVLGTESAYIMFWNRHTLFHFNEITNVSLMWRNDLKAPECYTFLWRIKKYFEL